MKAIGYLRVSSAKQAREEKDGFPRQREAIRAYCAGKRIELLEEHADAGVSGTVPLEGRDGLSMALARCTELGAGVLVVEKADRLGRDLIVSEMAVRAFAEAGVSIVTADTGQSLTDADNDPSRKLIRQVLNAVAEYERSALVAKLRAARERKKRSGGHAVGCYRFGAHPARPAEAETLARIRELRTRKPLRKRMPLARIAGILNDEKRESRTGRPWTSTMVRDAL
ncbi:MAG: recombinase family protein [Planctomycetes bacterium]|nr:recombinase family protein [Planctomycetota bacterium]